MALFTYRFISIQWKLKRSDWFWNSATANDKPVCWQRDAGRRYCKHPLKFIPQVPGINIWITLWLQFLTQRQNAAGTLREGRIQMRGRGLRALSRRVVRTQGQYPTSLLCQFIIDVALLYCAAPGFILLFRGCVYLSATLLKVFHVRRNVIEAIVNKLLFIFIFCQFRMMQYFL